MKKFILLLSFVLSFYFSNDCFSQWSQLNVGPSSLYVGAITSNSNYVYAASLAMGGGVYRSSDAGANWSACNNGFYAPFTTYLTSRNDTLFAGQSGSSSKVYYSANNGNSWQMIGLSGWNHYQIYLETNDIYVATSYGVYKTTNLGNNWDLLIQIPYAQTFARSSSVMYLGTQGLGMRFSTNGGANWVSTSNHSNANIKHIIIYDNNLYGAIYGVGFGVFNTTSGSWTLQNNGLSNLNINFLYRIGNTIFALTQGGGIFKSNIGAWNWTQINEGLTNQNIYAMGEKDDYVYATSDSGKVFKRLKSQVVSIKPVASTVPSEYSLEQNYPNPFNPMTNIQFTVYLCHSGVGRNPLIVIKIFDITGKEVRTLVNEELSAGKYEILFDAEGISSGVYFYSMSANGRLISNKRMVLIK